MFTIPLQELMDKANQSNAIVKKFESTRFSSTVGAGSMGLKCDRALYMRFKWYNMGYPGWLYRRFEQGDDAEDMIVDHLRERVGFDVINERPKKNPDDRAKQWGGYTFYNLIACRVDGFVRHPILMTDDWYLLEVKAMTENAFEKIKVKGVKKYRPVHYMQMQASMALTQLPPEVEKRPTRCLYVAMNTNNADIHAELVEFEPKLYAEYLDRAKRIIAMPSPPPRQKSPVYPPCKFCDFSTQCWGETTPKPSCRSCEHVELILPGGNTRPAKYMKWPMWVCNKKNGKVPNDFEACHQYETKGEPYEF